MNNGASQLSHELGLARNGLIKKESGIMVKKFSKLEKVAYHEAGHAMYRLGTLLRPRMVAHLLNLRFSNISIIPKDDYIGVVTRPTNVFQGFQPDIDSESSKSRKRIESEIMLSFAGRITEQLFSGRYTWKDSYQDDNNAINMASYMTGSEDELNAYTKWIWIRTKNLISNPIYWAAIQALANELIIRKEIKSREARKIIYKAMHRKQE
jgi:hypothetical protein